MYIFFPIFSFVLFISTANALFSWFEGQSSAPYDLVQLINYLEPYSDNLTKVEHPKPNFRHRRLEPLHILVCKHLGCNYTQIETKFPPQTTNSIDTIVSRKKIKEKNDHENRKVYDADQIHEYILRTNDYAAVDKPSSFLREKVSNDQPSSSRASTSQIPQTKKIDESSFSASTGMLKTKRKKEIPETNEMKTDESSSGQMSKTKTKKEIPDTKKAKIDESCVSTSQITKTTKKMPQTRKTKIDKSCSSTSTASQDTSVNVMNTSTQDFRDIRWELGFVDRTLLMKTVMECADSFILLTAPRCFGKSVNISMLERFFASLPGNEEEQQANRKLFEHTDIEDDSKFMEKHFGKYPVLYLDFRSAGAIHSYDSAFEFVRKVVQEGFKSHKYVGSSDELNATEKLIVNQWCDDKIYKTLATTDAELYEALLQLASYLVKYHNCKIFLFVDEYDGICSDSVIYVEDKISEKTGEIISSAEKEIKKIIAFCVGALSCLLKPDHNNDFVDRAVLTGISYIMTLGLSKLRNVEAKRFQENHSFSQYYGLTLGECKKVLARPTIKLDSEYEGILAHYNGYRNNVLSIWSVMKYLNDKMENKEAKMKNYWKDVGIIYDLYAALRITKVSSIITRLLSKVNYVYEIDLIRNITYRDVCKIKQMVQKPNPELQNVNIFFSFLLEQGYFSLVELNEDTQKVKIKIPNEEIRKEFSQEFLKFYFENYNLDITLIRECAALFDQICSFDDKKNKEILEKICELMNDIIESPEINNEATLHHFIFIIIFHSKRFKCFSEARANQKNKRRLDLLMLFEELGIILELKKDEKSEVGLFQIIDYKYCDAFDPSSEYNPDKLSVKYYILIGLSYVNKKIELSVLFNNLNRKKRVHIS